MTNEGYKQWREDAYYALLNIYSKDEAKTILDWFDTTGRDKEVRLIGLARTSAFAVFSCTKPDDGKWSIYNSMMARLWVYAPYILVE